ncbi:ppGpp synthetase/RelA/SpoT-type nucleotidyltransferase [Sphingomonas aurantiaca]|uniref:PpGpp synthetase/RelA/SpoT-type nucleotidyltransferase n=1 Tax=Sphingomonas aurantiaca TaxID=185949 RepID=A0A2T5GPG4_9SPHN|nr:RelA/SpoT domain-containing protein [Sphingomonas aurantiaca]PTQ61212.1 ppGpp synthetase/RelA/SpoT-type nucleotidyltransferase [Sphingomonas aurantiaca]
MKIERSIRDSFVTLEDVYKYVAKDVNVLLKDACDLKGWIFTERLKMLQSYALKLATGREIDDFFGCSIIVPTLSEVPAAEALVNSCLNVVDRRPKDIISQRPSEFQFDSVRLYCTLKGGVNPTEKHGLKFEVQIKTLLEQAWSKATHDFSYKASDISWAKERVAAQLKAMLDNVELSISQIDHLSLAPSVNKKNHDYESRRALLVYLRDELGRDAGVIMPVDMRRLTDIVHGLLKFMGAKLEELRAWVTAETAEGRGARVTDLSAYSMILQSAMNQDPAKFKLGLKDKRSKQKVFITNEVIVPPSIDLSTSTRVTRL